MVTNPTSSPRLASYRQAGDNLYLLPAAKSPMSKSVPETCTNLATALLIHYSFDLSGYSADELVHRWQKYYPADWLHWAVIEALYQGRYKGISVQQILAFWQRRGQVIYHFNMEFERLICNQFPPSLTANSPRALNLFPTATEPETAVVLPQLGENSQSNSASIPLMDNAQSESFNELETSATLPALPASSVNPLTDNSEASDTHLPIVINHPPIGQFTPAKSDRSELFTSKLKAISGEQLSSV